MNYLVEEGKLLYRRISKIYAIYVALLVILLLLPESVKDLTTVIINLAFTSISAFFVIGTIVLLVYPSFNLVVMIKENNQRFSEFTITNYYQTIVSKIIINIMVLGSGMILGGLAEGSMSKFATLGVSYFEYNLNESFIDVILKYGFFFPLLIAFVYLLVSKHSKCNHGLVTFFIVLVFYNSINSLKINSIYLYLGELCFGIFMICKIPRIKVENKKRTY